MTDDLIARLERHTVVTPQGDGAYKLYHCNNCARAARALRDLQARLDRWEPSVTTASGAQITMTRCPTPPVSKGGE